MPLIALGPLDPDHLTDADLDGCHAVLAARWAEDFPGEPPLTRAAALARLRPRSPFSGDPVLTAARAGDRVVGLADVRPLWGDNAHIAMVTVLVDPAARGRGTGGALLRHALADLDHELVHVRDLVEGGTGQRWAAALGMRPFYRCVLQRADLADIPPAEPAPAGYALRAWRGAAPDDLLAAYTEARGALADAPAGSGGFRIPGWTAERVRAHERRMREAGTEVRVVAALHGAEVAAYTELLLGPGRADQNDTAVVPAHRGRGLGRCVKLHQAALLRATPGLAVPRITTTTASEPMRRVNTGMGFRDVRTLVSVEAATADLRSALRRGPGNPQNS